MNQRAIFYGFLALIVAGGLASLWVAQQEVSKTATPTKTTKPVPLHTVGENVTFTVTKASHKKWELRVKEATYFKDHSGADLKSVEGEFYDPNGKAVATFKAPSGIFRDDQKAVTLTGGVTVAAISKDGGKVMAPKVIWSSRSDLVNAEGGVTVDMGNNRQSTAQKCQFTLDFSTISLSGGARTQMTF